MSGELHEGEEPGTILEAVAYPVDAETEQSPVPPGVTALEPSPPLCGSDGPGPANPEVAYRPNIRPMVPRLTLLDDGESERGEIFRLREPVTLIGRTEGAIRLSHDPLVSGRHAEVIREGASRPHRWLLRDLGSSNGTFARCSRTVLRETAILILGSRRFRFRSPQPTLPPHGRQNATMPVDMPGFLAGGLATLVETGATTGGLVLSLTGADTGLGRPGYGNAIEIEDPLLANRHARIQRDNAGRWTLEALPSVNGVWVQIAAVPLTNKCRFQIGEQRFFFELD